MYHIDFNTSRHELYEDMLNLYNNDQAEVFRNRLPSVNEITEYIQIPFPKEIVNLYSDLAFRNDISAIVKNNDEANTAIDRLIQENELNTLLSESSIDCAIKGGVIFKNYLESSMSKIDYVRPELYFPEFSPFNRKKIIRETLAHTYMEGKTEYIYREIYEPRNGEYWVITKVNIYKDGKIQDEISSEEQNIKLKQSPLTYVPFYRKNGEFFGDSIYKGMEPLFDELNYRITQLSRIFDKFTDPHISGSATFLDEDKTLTLSGGSKYFPTDEGESPPQALVWKAELDQNLDYINNVLLKLFYITSPLKPELYGVQEKSSGQETGIAAKVKFWRTTSMVDRSLNYWRSALKKVLYNAQQLEIVSGKEKYTPAYPDIKIVQGLPMDDHQLAQAEQLKVQSGITSKKAAIARLNPSMTSKEVENEWLDMINEKVEEDNQLFASNSQTQNNGDI